jgi:DNA-binding NarL/FixJ family response regulator
LHKEIHELKKELKEKSPANSQLDDKYATAEEFEAFTNIIIQKLRDLQNDGTAFKEAVFERLKRDEAREKIAQNTSMPLTASMADEQKIISLFESGFSLEDIARQLRVNVGEIEFVLKLHNVKTRSLF